MSRASGLALKETKTRNSLQKQRKQSFSEDYNINGWGEGGKSKILLHNLTIV